MPAAGSRKGYPTDTFTRRKLSTRCGVGLTGAVRMDAAPQTLKEFLDLVVGSLDIEQVKITTRSGQEIIYHNFEPIESAL